MSTFIFQQIAKRGKVIGINNKDIQVARDWFRNKARRLQVDPEELHASNKSRLFTRMGPEDIGTMLMYFYDPKHRDELPYWDKFPLIFVVEVGDTWFHGINLHYLPPMLRAKLMDALWTIAVKHKDEKIVRLKLSYQVLKSAAKFAPFKPTFKMYLKNHVRSRFFFVESREWDTAIGLPVQTFQKATNQTVWKHSRRIIKGG